MHVSAPVMVDTRGVSLSKHLRLVSQSINQLVNVGNERAADSLLGWKDLLNSDARSHVNTELLEGDGLDLLLLRLEDALDVGESWRVETQVAGEDGGQTDLDPLQAEVDLT